MSYDLAAQKKHGKTAAAISIQPVAIFDDNYVWLIVHADKQEAIAIDVGDATPVMDFLCTQGLTLRAIWITHHHHDHIGGVEALCQAYPNVCVYAHRAHLSQMTLPQTVCVTQVAEGSLLSAWEAEVIVWETYGHTDSHLSYLLNLAGVTHVFCGDTLFSAGCGRIFTGTYAQMYCSLQRYLHLTDDTWFYPAHEYTLGNLMFCAYIEPENKAVVCAIDALKKMQLENPRHISLPVQLKHERRVNVFLRTDMPDVITAVKVKAGLADDADGLAIFAALRHMKNTF